MRVKSTKAFRSLRKKLVLKLGFTYLIALGFIIALIVIKNTYDFNESVAEIESRTKQSLINKGMLLVENNSNALIGLVEDNSYTSVSQIVSKTVASDDDIVYGVFSDLQRNDWARAFKTDLLEVFKSTVDGNANWAFQQQEAASISFQFGQLQVIEFAAPVMIEGEALGVIRYGLSTAMLAATISAANEKATDSLILTLLGLTLVGGATLVMTYVRTDQVAKRFTVPLNMLTEAADVVANGQYDQEIGVETDDEIGLLADNFDAMKFTIKRTIADLDEINHIGAQLAKTRDELLAYDLVLHGILKQLHFEVGLIFYARSDADNELVFLSHVQLDRHEDTDVLRLANIISQQQEVIDVIKAGLEEPEFLTFQLSQRANETAYRLFELLPFGQRGHDTLFLVLSTKTIDKTVEQSNLDFCFSISHLLETALKNISMQAQLEEQNRTLEDKVTERTQELKVQNLALSSTLEELEKAQIQLVEAEKMASLGNLVAGISHEVNTPLGVSVTAASHLNETTELFNQKFLKGELTKSGFTTYLEGASQASEIILANLERAATLIQSFKQIAVDQSSDVKAEFNVKEHLDSLIISLRPTYKKLPISLNLIGDDDITVNSYPGLLTQVVSNLVLNSIKHGLKDCDKGEINVVLGLKEGLVSIVVEDNGKGIPDAIKAKVFDPFFTTSRGEGGSGLGLNIVYNLVKQKLNGEVSLEDNQPQGARFTIIFPG